MKQHIASWHFTTSTCNTKGIMLKKGYRNLCYGILDDKFIKEKKNKEREHTNFKKNIIFH